VLSDGERGRQFGRAFSRAEKLRVASDYEEQVAPTAAEALDLCATAVDFVAYCRSLL